MKPALTIYPVRNPVVVTKFKLGGVAMKMLFPAVLINAFHAALEDAEITFNRVCVDVAAYIIAFTVSGEIVFCKLLAKACILFGFVRVHDCLFRYIVTQNRQQGSRFHIVYDKGF